MSFAVILATQAQAQLEALYDEIAIRASPNTALRFTADLPASLDTLRDFPHQGSGRNDIIAGLRTLGFRRRMTIAFIVELAAVLILSLFYGGQDFETLLKEHGTAAPLPSLEPPG